MSRLRGREVYIIAGVVAVVVIVAWYFLLLSPTRNDISSLNDQISAEQVSLAQAKQDVARLEQYKKTAPQARADIVSLSKALPGSTGVPSLLIELPQTASTSGVTLTSISNGQVQPGTPFGIQTITLNVQGTYFDLEDFFYRLENYVQLHNTQFVATGRLLQMTTVSVSGGSSSGTATSSGSPTLQAAVTLNAYLQPASTPPAASASTSGGAQ